MEDRDPSSSVPSFICQEDKSCLNEEKDKMTDPSNLPCCHLGYDYDYEDDYIHLLIRKEMDPGFGSSRFGSLSTYPSWLKHARSDSVNWILNTKTVLGFRNRTAYLSITYFDRFLSIRSLDEDKLWAIRLLSIACLSLAAKTEESKIPAFSEYPVEEGFGFDFKVIQKMELLVLSTMGWKMNLVTPFSYFYYLVRKLGNQEANLDELVSRAIELVMASTKEINPIENRPSMIAIAAVLAAIDRQLTREGLKHRISTVALWHTSENEEELFTCYSLMQRLASNGDASTPNLTQVNQESGANTSVTGTKRKLTFNDTDQNATSAEKIQRH